MTLPVTIVAGGSSAAREMLIAARLQRGCPTAILLEGIPDGNPVLEQPTPNSAADPAIDLIRTAAGCPCCSGNLTIRVMLNRLLRKRPQQLFIGIADPSHVSGLQEFLAAPPYDTLLHVESVVFA